MGILHSDALVIEHPWGFGRVLLRTKYRVSVYDDHGTALGAVAERGGPGALSLARVTHLSASTPFRLAVTQRDGQEVLRVDKGFTFGEVAGFEFGAHAKRDGDRVRRDVLRLRPGLAGTVRLLAVATGVAFDIVRGQGTSAGNASPKFPGV